MPIWIEAATEYVRDWYAKLGFVVVGEWRLGKGKVDEGGADVAKGETREGVKIWGMVWWPEGKGRKGGREEGSGIMKAGSDHTRFSCL
jgi:hypothetical protein